MARKLKVFCWSDGLHDYTVAASSRAVPSLNRSRPTSHASSALAREIVEGRARDAALDAPETVVTTPAGGLGAALKALPAKARRKPSKAETARAEKLAALKADLEAVEDEAEASELACAERRSALDAEEAAAMEGFEARRTELEKAIKVARS